MQQINQIDKNGLEQGYWEIDADVFSYKRTGYFVNGVREGEWKQYYPNGVLWFVGNFKNDWGDGLCFEYDEQSNLLETYFVVI